jgi:hypothetical protein
MGDEEFGERTVLPPLVVDHKEGTSTPGTLDVPDWYLAELRKEPGWIRRFEPGWIRRFADGEILIQDGTEIAMPSASASLDEALAETKRANTRALAAKRVGDDLRAKLREAEAKLEELELDMATRPPAVLLDPSATKVHGKTGKTRS